MCLSWINVLNKFLFQVVKDLFGCFYILIFMIGRATNALINVCDHDVVMMIDVLMLEHLVLYIILWLVWWLVGLIGWLIDWLVDRLVAVWWVQAEINVHEACHHASCGNAFPPRRLTTLGVFFYLFVWKKVSFYWRKW